MGFFSTVYSIQAIFKSSVFVDWMNVKNMTLYLDKGSPTYPTGKATKRHQDVRLFRLEMSFGKIHAVTDLEESDATMAMIFAGIPNFVTSFQFQVALFER